MSGFVFLKKIWGQFNKIFLTRRFEGENEKFKAIINDRQPNIGSFINNEFTLLPKIITIKKQEINNGHKYF